MGPFHGEGQRGRGGGGGGFWNKEGRLVGYEEEKKEEQKDRGKGI
jgi:hypothetical protein